MISLLKLCIFHLLSRYLLQNTCASHHKQKKRHQTYPTKLRWPMRPSTDTRTSMFKASKASLCVLRTPHLLQSQSSACASCGRPFTWAKGIALSLGGFKGRAHVYHLSSTCTQCEAGRKTWGLLIIIGRKNEVSVKFSKPPVLSYYNLLLFIITIVYYSWNCVKETTLEVAACFACFAIQVATCKFPQSSVCRPQVSGTSAMKFMILGWLKELPGKWSNCAL